jgi:hypothetical protein
MGEQGPRVRKDPPDTFDVRDPIEHQLPDGGFELRVRLHMDMDVRDPGHGAR